MPETCLAFATASVFGSKVCLKSFNWGYIVIGIMEKKMEPTIVYWGYIYIWGFPKIRGTIWCPKKDYCILVGLSWAPIYGN